MFWPEGITLANALDMLPEPILVVGNKLVDGDTAGCIAALIEDLRFSGKEVFTHFVVEPMPIYQWMFDGDDIGPTSILQDYESLIVVDDFVDAERLGIQIKKVPTINIDHHSSNRPEGVEMGEPDKLFVQARDNLLHFWSQMPAAACLLIANGIYHPLLWTSIKMDTVGLTVNAVSGVKWLARLVEGLAASGITFGDEEQEALDAKMNRKGTMTAFDKLMNANIYFFRGTYNERDVQLALGIVDSENADACLNALSVLRKYSDVTAVVSKANGKGSLRSENYDYDVCQIAKQFGGGGHIRASGFSIDPKKNFMNDIDKLIELLLTNVTNVGTKIYV